MFLFTEAVDRKMISKFFYFSVYFLANVLCLALTMGFFGINPGLATEKIPQFAVQIAL